MLSGSTQMQSCETGVPHIAELMAVMPTAVDSHCCAGGVIMQRKTSNCSKWPAVPVRLNLLPVCQVHCFKLIRAGLTQARSTSWPQ